MSVILWAYCNNEAIAKLGLFPFSGSAACDVFPFNLMMILFTFPENSLSLITISSDAYPGKLCNAKA